VAIDLLADASSNSTLPAGEVTKEKEVILAKSDMCLDDPDSALGRRCLRPHSECIPIASRSSGIGTFFSARTRDDLLAYYRTRYSTEQSGPGYRRRFRSRSHSRSRPDAFWQAAAFRSPAVLVPDEPVQLPGATSTFSRTCRFPAPAWAGRFRG